MRRHLVLGGAVVVAAMVVSAARFGSGDGQRPDTAPAVLALAPADVQRLSVEAPGQRVELHRNGLGTWQAAAGTPPQVAALVFGLEDRLLPVRAYRTVPADPADPQYSLADPALSLTAEDRAGQRHRVVLGAESFSGGGFYARLASSSRLFLVPRRTMDDLRSLLAGQTVTSAAPVPGADAAAGPAPSEEPTPEGAGPWLQQTLDAGARLPEDVQ